MQSALLFIITSDFFGSLMVLQEGNKKQQNLLTKRVLESVL
jgi:hypothetical protein